MTNKQGTAFFCWTMLIASGSAFGNDASMSDVQMQKRYQCMSDRLIDQPRFDTYRNFLSEKLLAEIATESEQDLDEQVRFMAPSLWFDKVETFHEGAVDGRMCLIVNGISVDGDPISAAAEYVQEQGRLQIRAVEISFYDQEAALPEQPWCPVRPGEMQ